VRALRDDVYRAVSEHLEYLRKHRRRIRYASLRRPGMPIGSGATEGACKSAIATRFKRGGQRWLRTLHLSERTTAAETRGPTTEVMDRLMAAFGDAMEQSRGGAFGAEETAALALTNEIARRWLESELARTAASIPLVPT
jgi:hypothetical protein